MTHRSTLRLGIALLAPAAMVAVGLTAVPPPAEALAPTTCQGKAVTVVGVARGTTFGTSGDDVIVSNGAQRVVGLAGDDTVCMTRNGSFVPAVSVADVSTGNDSVTVDYARSYRKVTVHLGPGDDKFVGASGRDFVVPSDLDFDRDEGDVDSIETRSGNDYLDVRDIADGEVLHGTIDTGPGDDEVWLRGGRTGDDAVLTGGTGTDELFLDRRLGEAGPGPGIAINAPQRTAVEGGVTVLRWSAFESFRVAATQGLTFTGTPGRDVLRADESVGSVEATMGAGNDLVDLGRLGGTSESPIVPIDVDAGAGTDKLDVSLSNRDTGMAYVNLARGAVEWYSVDQEAKGHVRGAENARVDAGRVTVRGTNGPNVLELTCWGRDLQAYGSGGADRLLSEKTSGSYCPNGVRFDGGKGNDLLVGSDKRDTLLGRGGRDILRGGAARDICRGEVQISC